MQHSKPKSKLSDALLNGSWIILTGDQSSGASRPEQSSSTMETASKSVMRFHQDAMPVTASHRSTISENRRHSPAGLFCVLFLILCHATGCLSSNGKSKTTTPSKPVFQQLYSEAQPQLIQHQLPEANSTLVTLSVQNIPLHSLLTHLAQQSGVSIVSSDQLISKPVTIEVYEQPLDAVLSYIARQVNADISRTGNMYFLGTLRPEDIGVLVYRMKRLKSSEAAAAIGVMKSDYGSIHTFPDGLIVVGDRVEVLRRITEMIERIEATDSVTWAVQLHLVSLSGNSVKELGLDLVPSVDVALSLSNQPITANANAQAALSAVLRATRERSDNKLVADPFFLVLDGTPAKLKRGTRYPIPLRTVTDQGTTTTREYQFLDVGLSIAVTVRELSDDSARLDLNCQLAQVESITAEGAPIFSEESLTAQSDVQSGGVYLLASLDRSETGNTSARGIGLGGRSRHDSGVLQVWARVHRIGCLTK